MNRFFILLLLVLMSLADASSALASPPGRHRPHYTAYKHRGDARKRWRRMGVLGRWRYRRQHRRPHGVIKVGPPRATMPPR
jgi:hypothetical protein